MSLGEPVSGRSVDGETVLREEGVGGVDRGFGSVPFHVKGFKTSCLAKCAQYPSSSARYTQVVSSPSFAAPGTIRRIF